LDRVILHTVVHHSSTSTYTPNIIKIEKRRPTLLSLKTRSQPKISLTNIAAVCHLWNRFGEGCLRFRS